MPVHVTVAAADCDQSSKVLFRDLDLTPELIRLTAKIIIIIIKFIMR